MHPGVVLAPPHVAAGKVNGAFALDESNHLSNVVFRWNRHQYMHIIGLQMPFQDLALLLTGQIVKHQPQMLAQLPVQNL